MGTLTSPIPWYGGKTLLAKHILPLLPKHTCYVEAFGGSGAILFGKEPSKVEVYNDINKDVVNLFRVLRDEGKAERLHNLLTLTPYSRGFYEELAADSTALDDVDAAYRFYILIRQSVNGVYKNGFCRGTSRPSAKYFANAVDKLPDIVGRLRSVCIEQLDWRELFKRWDTQQTLWYLDPPYLPETRVAKTRYQHELSREDHVELLAKIKELKGKVVLSGYGSPMYEHELAGWRRVEIETISHGTVTSGAKPKRIEVVWLNWG